VSPSDLQALLSVDPAMWQKEMADIRDYLQSYGKRVPAELLKQLDAADARLA
jgi:phosphoenolpyruvate carboxykinase (GTP)